MPGRARRVRGPSPSGSYVDRVAPSSRARECLSYPARRRRPAARRCRRSARGAERSSRCPAPARRQPRRRWATARSPRRSARSRRPARSICRVVTGCQVAPSQWAMPPAPPEPDAVDEAAVRAPGTPLYASRDVAPLLPSQCCRRGHRRPRHRSRRWCDRQHAAVAHPASRTASSSCRRSAGSGPGASSAPTPTAQRSAAVPRWRSGCRRRAWRARRRAASAAPSQWMANGAPCSCRPPTRRRARARPGRAGRCRRRAAVRTVRHCRPSECRMAPAGPSAQASPSAVTPTAAREPTSGPSSRAKPLRRNAARTNGPGGRRQAAGAGVARAPTAQTSFAETAAIAARLYQGRTRWGRSPRARREARDHRLRVCRQRPAGRSQQPAGSRRRRRAADHEQAGSQAPTPTTSTAAQARIRRGAGRREARAARRAARRRAAERAQSRRGAARELLAELFDEVVKAAGMVLSRVVAQYGKVASQPLEAGLTRWRMISLQPAWRAASAYDMPSITRATTASRRSPLSASSAVSHLLAHPLESMSSSARSSASAPP